METDFIIQSNMQTIENIISQLRQDPLTSKNFATWNKKDARKAKFVSFPNEIHPALVHGLTSQGITSLYTHQREAWKFIQAKKNIAIVTGTASGKSLCYNIPVLNSILHQNTSKALYLFPTKALAHDQYQWISNFFDQIHTNPEFSFPRFRGNYTVATYDGDTPATTRKLIRETSSIVITNPDMLHIGILPHHAQWRHFLMGIKFVIIDEIHIYRGAFGSHVCNVLRRLKRIARFYNTQSQFILTSATIGNPGEHAAKLIESPVDVIDEDGSPRGLRHFAIYNPPIINQELNIRSNRLHETSLLAKLLYKNHVQSIIFSLTRRSVELLLLILQKELSNDDVVSSRIRGYRSGYLAEHRRKLEKGLKNGEISTIIATTALELGIDCGEIDAAIIDGYPGTISGTWQQAGRAGRKTKPSLAILVVSSNPLDQFLARNPDYIFHQNPEKALINPNNLLIVLEHIKCALFELPFSANGSFGSLESSHLLELFDLLVQSGTIYKSKDKYYWSTSNYPANDVSLRNASPIRYKLCLHRAEGERLIGEIDYESVFWMAHPDAIYLQEGESYLVEELDTDNHRVNLRKVQPDYYTKPQLNMEIELLNELMREPSPGGWKVFGELLIHEQVTGYNKIRWEHHEIMESIPLSLPPIKLNTIGYIFNFDKKMIDQLRESGWWSNDRVDYGPKWNIQKRKVLLRDSNSCQQCGKRHEEIVLHVHHKIPVRMFDNLNKANQLKNLITLCASCHRRAESSVRIRSGLAGLAYLIRNIVPIYIMCDRRDLGVHIDPHSHLNGGEAALVTYDRMSGGLGFSREVFNSHKELIKQASLLVQTCDCEDGCPACVGPGGEFGQGSKIETEALLEILNQ